MRDGEWVHARVVALASRWLGCVGGLVVAFASKRLVASVTLVRQKVPGLGGTDVACLLHVVLRPMGRTHQVALTCVGTCIVVCRRGRAVMGCQGSGLWHRHQCPI